MVAEMPRRRLTRLPNELLIATVVTVSSYSLATASTFCTID